MFMYTIFIIQYISKKFKENFKIYNTYYFNCHSPPTVDVTAFESCWILTSLYPPCIQIYKQIHSQDRWKLQKQKVLIIWRKKDWRSWTERECTGRLKQGIKGWWMNMERGETSFADSWWKKAQNTLKLDKHTTCVVFRPNSLYNSASTFPNFL